MIEWVKYMSVCCAFFSFTTYKLHARELNFDESQLYYEILFDIGISLSTTYMEKKFASEKGRDSFPTQKIDDQVSRWLHGGTHAPYTTSNEHKLDDISGHINSSLMIGTLLSPIFKEKGHRLGTFMTIIHSQEIWFFINRTLKVTVERQRPKFHYTKDPSTSDTSSFPSGLLGRRLSWLLLLIFYLKCLFGRRFRCIPSLQLRLS